MSRQEFLHSQNAQDKGEGEGAEEGGGGEHGEEGMGAAEEVVAVGLGDEEDDPEGGKGAEQGAEKRVADGTGAAVAGE